MNRRSVCTPYLGLCVCACVCVCVCGGRTNDESPLGTTALCLHRDTARTLNRTVRVICTEAGRNKEQAQPTSTISFLGSTQCPRRRRFDTASWMWSRCKARLALLSCLCKAVEHRFATNLASSVRQSLFGACHAVLKSLGSAQRAKTLLCWSPGRHAYQYRWPRSAMSAKNVRVQPSPT